MGQFDSRYRRQKQDRAREPELPRRDLDGDRCVRPPVSEREQQVDRDGAGEQPVAGNGTER